MTSPSGLPSSGGPSCGRYCGCRKEGIVKWAPGAEIPASQAGEGDDMVERDEKGSQ